MRDFTVKQVQAAGPGRHRVSQSLYLFVGPGGQPRRWIFRFTKPGTGRVTEKGLGSADVVTLAEARTKVHDYRRLVAKGGDPVDQQTGGGIARTIFVDVANEYLDIQAKRFRNPGSTKNARLLLLKHASGLADMAIDRVGSSQIDAALRPLWLTSPEQARRAVAAVLRVLKYAKAKGLTTASAADMRESMSALLPHVNGTKRHFRALEYKDIPAFVQTLRAAQAHGDALSPAVIEFIVLTAARENEVCGMKWQEINWLERVWTLPPERSKTGREHRVPLCDRAMHLISLQRGPTLAREPADPNGYVWPGRSGYEPVTGKSVYKYLTQTMGISATIHGFRSSFRDWAGDTTHFARNDLEECLGHAVGGATERAYRRKDGLDKRRVIMEAWANHCAGAGPLDHML
jgi:integrase